MRQSMVELIERSCYLKNYLCIGSYELHHYDDGSFSDFHVSEIKNPKDINKVIGPLSYRIFQDERGIVIRVFEDFKEY